MAKNQASAKQHPEAELLLFENYPHSSSTFSSKNDRAYHNKRQRNRYVCMHEIVRLIMMKIKMKMKNRSHTYNINRPRFRHGYKYSKYKKCLTMIMLTCINPFSTIFPLLYPLETSENRRFFCTVRGYRSGTLVENGLSNT